MKVERFKKLSLMFLQTFSAFSNHIILNFFHRRMIDIESDYTIGSGVKLCTYRCSIIILLVLDRKHIKSFRSEKKNQFHYEIVD